MTPLEKITERVNRLGHPDDPSTPRPLLTVEEFFDGNTTTGSIGCNLESRPQPSQFYDLFTAILQRPDVKDVRIQITVFDVPDWPFSDTVYILTSATTDEVESWFPADLKPDETWIGFTSQDFEPYEVQSGAQVVACWWD